MKKCLILCLCFVFWFPAIACDCKENDGLKQEQKASFEQHDLIFIGKVIAINSDGSYQFKIIELFKEWRIQPFLGAQPQITALFFLTKLAKCGWFTQISIRMEQLTFLAVGFQEAINLRFILGLLFFLHHFLVYRTMMKQ